jgi:hypothetical protein
MRIDPSGTIGGYPTLFVGKLMRKPNGRFHWDLEAIRDIAALSPREARTLMRALERERLARVNRVASGERWDITQLGQSFASATAAKPLRGKRPREPWRGSWHASSG